MPALDLRHESLRWCWALRHVWAVGELVEMALAPDELLPPRFAPFTAIRSGPSCGKVTPPDSAGCGR